MVLLSKLKVLFSLSNNTNYAIINNYSTLKLLRFAHIIQGYTTDNNMQSCVGLLSKSVPRCQTTSIINFGSSGSYKGYEVGHMLMLATPNTLRHVGKTVHDLREQ